MCAKDVKMFLLFILLVGGAARTVYFLLFLLMIFVVFETIIFYSICCYFLFTHSTFPWLVLCLFLAIILTQLLVSLPFNYLTAV